MDARSAVPAVRHCHGVPSLTILGAAIAAPLSLFTLSMKNRFALIACLACLTGSGIVAEFYGRRIALAPSPAVAAPYAAPFALFAVAAAASFACAAAAVTDTAIGRR
jgi:hypothetical protein